MAIPDFQSMMLPLLQIIADGQEHQMRDLNEKVADHFQLTETERHQKLPIGNNKVLGNRVAWAKAHLGNAKLLDTVRRGFVKITERGRSVLAQSPSKIDLRLLKQFPEHVAFLRGNATSTNEQPEHQASDDVTSTITPEEQIDTAYESLRTKLSRDLLDHVLKNSDQFFEQLVVDLLVAMGYGGSIEDAGKAVGKSGDGGIDGVIKEDKLGLDTIVIQAKKWNGHAVGRPDVQAFAGSKEGHRAHKGVFITTSTFSQPALDFVKQIQRRIVLIDGQELANLMIDHGIGVSISRSFVLRRVDSDYFEDSE